MIMLYLYSPRYSDTEITDEEREGERERERENEREKERVRKKEGQGALQVFCLASQVSGWCFHVHVQYGVQRSDVRAESRAGTDDGTRTKGRKTS